MALCPFMIFRIAHNIQGGSKNMHALQSVESVIQPPQGNNFYPS